MVHFFFQAEDGIRDRNVTGVQTCALPIFASVPLEEWGRAIETNELFPKKINVHFAQVVSRTELIQRTWERGAGATLARSEERRVGKECSSQGAAVDYNENAGVAEPMPHRS